MRLPSLLLAALVFVAAALAEEPKKIRVLLIDGQNNHDWPATTAWLQKFLTASGRFTVDVSTTPPKGASVRSWEGWQPKFSAYDVVLSNFNGGHLANGTRWPVDVEAAFENYLRRGGGFVSFHAANNSFFQWPAYNDIVGLLWRDKSFGPSLIIDEKEKVVFVPANEGRNAGHPPRYTFHMTTLNTEHPITQGFPKKWLHPSEQLTHGQHGPDGVVSPATINVLTYAWSESVKERQPMDWVRNYGKGRVYVTMLGHTWKNEEPDNPNLRCVGFQTLFLRGLEWAATGQVTVPIPADFPTEDKISVRPGPIVLPSVLLAAKRVLILGDSITYGGNYVDFVETVVRRRAPEWRGEIISLGLSSETVSGLSEVGHAGGKFPRPDLHERLDRVLAQTKPDLVLACYGMNDGIYFPFSEERFAKFRDGMVRLREKVAAARATLVHVTPPVFDPVPIAAKVLPDGLDAYPAPFSGYNDVLDRYSAWLLAQRGKGWDVIDVHGVMAATIARLRETDPKFTFSKDGVHPDALGHAVMARAILNAWGLRPDDDEMLGHLATGPDGELLKLVRERRKLLGNAWLTATGHKRPGVAAGLPLPEAEAKAAALEEKIRALLGPAP